MSHRTATLAELTAELAPLATRGELGRIITHVTYDSRRVQPGSLFVALRGAQQDGHAYLDQAIRAGASGLLVELPPGQVPPGPAVVQVADCRAALPSIARLFHGDPVKWLRLAGFTGTNGKTTCTYLLEAVGQAAGLTPGRIGTLGIRFGEAVRTTRNTTPESLDLHEIFREMVEAGVDLVAMEVSSHALASHRVDGLHFTVRVFTNLTRDHLDLHGTEEAYFQAKRRLFTEFGGGRRWVNLDDPWGCRLAAEVPGCLGFSKYPRADAALYVERWEQRPNGISAELASPWGTLAVESPLVGEFNLENLLAVVGAALSLGVGPEAIRQGLASSGGAPGRLERVVDPAGELLLFVDYAHTPDALARVLTELRRQAEQTRGQLWAVFGCGGDRDRGKRAEMGEVASALADRLILTDDNPRNESSASILAEIRAGVPAGRSAELEPDRARAIAYAVQAAQPGDVVLIAGKGAEDYQERNGVRYPFSDAEQARIALRARRGEQ